MTDLLIRTISKFWDGIWLGVGIIFGCAAFVKSEIWFGWISLP